MRGFKVSERLDAILKKLSKKDRGMREQVLRKISEIVGCEDIEHYKNLRYALKNCKRVHIGHFVLIFQYDAASDFILFDDFDHHDNIYGRSG